MKKVKQTKTAKSTAAKKKAKSKLSSQSKVPVTPIHDTSGGEMPNPIAKSRVSRKDVRLGFR